MARIHIPSLLDELYNYTTSHLEFLKELGVENEESLLISNTPNQWNILQNLEHLHRYATFYHEEILTRIKISVPINEEFYTSTWLGEYFAQSMLPKEGYKKIKTFKNMNPINDVISMEILNVFKNDLDQLIYIIDTCRNYSLNNIKTSISITQWLKLKLGDTLRVIVYHNERHFHQMKDIMQSIKNGH